MSVTPQFGVQVFDAHPDAHWLLDDRGVLKHANKAALRLMGNLAKVPAGEKISNLVVDEATRCEDLIRQGLRSTVSTPARLRLRTGETGEVSCRCDIALLSPAASGVPALLWCRLVEQGLGRNQFAVLNQQIQALKLEVVRRQGAEADMRRQSEWLETVLLGIAEGVVATDVNGYVLFMNPVASKLTGWPRDLALGQPISEVVQLVSLGSLDAKECAAALSVQLSDRHLDGKRLQLVGKGGTLSVVQVSTSALTSESGASRGTVFVLRLVESELKAEREQLALEHQLRESQKMEALGTMAGGIAHDFNNIVAAILGNVELALEDTAPDSDSRVSLIEIRKSGRRARDLVQQILTFSRRQDNTRAPVAVEALLQETQQMLRTALPAEAELVIQAEGRLPAVWGNATQIEQVFLNLTGNAAQALQGRALGKVWVHASRFMGAPLPCDPDEIEVIPMDAPWPDVSLCIRVSDNGVGMAPPTLARIFEPFFTTKPVGSGTGLGLAVMHGILREHNAALRVKSNLGQGTVFSVWLPAMDDSASSNAALQATQEDVVPIKAKGAVASRILYVDDDEAMAFLVQRFLDRNGYRVTTCFSPDEALRVLRSDDSVFALCITDYNMPGMSGLTLARQIKSLRPALSVAIASGYISDELRELAPQAGVSELIYKPNTVEELCRSIERLVERDAAGEANGHCQ